MAQNDASQTTGEPTDEPHTIIVDPDDVVTAIRFNEEDAAHGRSRTAQLWVRQGEATLQYHEQGNYFPAGQGPAYRINPAAFVCADGDPEGAERIEGTMYPTYGETRALVKDEQDVEEWDDVDEDTVDDWHDEAVEIWEQEVRAALQDEIVVREQDSAGRRVEQRLAVEYDDPELTADGGQATGQQRDEADEPLDLSDALPTVRFRRAGNNEELVYYPEAGDAAFGVVEHRYDGWPARGVVRFDVIGWEIVDADFDSEPYYGSVEEDLEKMEAEIREWVEEVLCQTDSTRGSASFRDEGGHTIRVIDDYEGDEYVVELETENRRRIA